MCHGEVSRSQKHSNKHIETHVRISNVDSESRSITSFTRIERITVTTMTSFVAADQSLIPGDAPDMEEWFKRCGDGANGAAQCGSDDDQNAKPKVTHRLTFPFHLLAAALLVSCSLPSCPEKPSSFQ